MSTVDALHYEVDLGEWRGHKIVYQPKAGVYASESAGIADAKTLAEVKRCIDAQEKKSFRPVKALLVDRDSWSAPRGSEVTILRPAQVVPRWYNKDKVEESVWVVGADGKRRKEVLDRYAPDTPQVRAVLDQYKAMEKEAKALQARADQLLKDLPRAPMPEELEPGDPE